MKKQLSDINYIPSKYKYSLMEYANDYICQLNNKDFEIITDNFSLHIVFMKRHYAHIVGLHNFLDTESSNHTLRNSNNLKGNEAITNILNESITMNDLISSRHGYVFSNEAYRKRLLSSHLISEMIYHSTLYKVNKVVKNKVQADYILVSNVDHTSFCLCLRTDSKLKKLGDNYCCISNLIDDETVRKMINNGKISPININYVIKRKFRSITVLSAINCNHFISPFNRGVSTNTVTELCVLSAITENRVFMATISKANQYDFSYVSFDKETVEFIDKNAKKN